MCGTAISDAFLKIFDSRLTVNLKPNFYPSAFKGCAGIAFIHGVWIDWILNGLYKSIYQGLSI